MTLAWKADMATGRKFVLLALCDNANDQGECYPSVAMLSKKCSMAERSIQKHIAELADLGILTRIYRTGRSTIYQINPRKLCTPAECAPQQNAHPTPATGAPPPQQLAHPTPATGAPITIKEPSIEPSRKQKTRGNAAKSAFDPMGALLAEGVLEQTAQDWLAVRKAHRAELTQTALDQVKREAAQAGMPLESALALCCARGWRGFEAAWVLQPGRASPAPRGAGAYETASQKAKSFADRLTGKTAHEPDDRTIIDIDPA